MTLPRSGVWQAAGLVLLVIAVYANSVGNSWHYDDRHAIAENPHIRSLDRLPQLLTDPTLFSRDADKAMFRPLLLASFALNYAWTQGEVYSYRLVNILIHAAVAAGVWQLLRALGLGAGLSLAGGALFALHPIATEPVNYICARSESLAALFVLSSVVLHLRAGDGRAAPMRALSVACFALGLLCKSVAVVLPVLLVAVDWATARSWRRAWRAYLPYGIVAIAYLLVVRTFLQRAVAEEPVRSAGVQLGTQAKAAVHYAKLLALPVDLNVHHVFHAAAWSPAVAAAVALLASLTYLLWAAHRRHRLMVLAGLWVAVPLAPTAVVPLNVLVNDHRLYLSLVGLTLMTALLLGGQRRTVHLATVLCLVCLGALTVGRNRDWLTPHTLWSDSLRQAPEPIDPVAYMHLGNYAKARGAPAEAAGYYRKAMEIAPDNVAVRNNLGTAYQAMGDHARAMAVFEDLLREDAGLGEARYNLARSQQEVGKLRQAIDNYLRVPADNYNYHAVLNNAGTAYEMAGVIDSAAHWYRQALALRPDSPDARRNLSRLVRELPARAPDLIESGQAGQLGDLCRVLVGVAPRDQNALYYLSVARLLEGQIEGSIDVAVELVRAHPGFEEGYLHLANAYETAGRNEEALATYEGQLTSRPAGPLADLARQRRDALLERIAGTATGATANTPPSRAQ